jgi:hypothetical protein
VTSDGVAPHDDYLTQFPFLGVPNAEGSGDEKKGALLSSEQ